MVLTVFIASGNQLWTGLIVHLLNIIKTELYRWQFT